MVKILHTHYCYNLPIGIKNQLVDEAAGARALAAEGITWHVKYFVQHAETPKDIFVHVPPADNWLANYFRLRTVFYRWLNRVQGDYDVMLLRYQPADIFLPWQVGLAPRLLTVHHTFEEEQMRLLRSSWRSRLEYHLERQGCRLIFRRLAGLVCVTPEIATYERTRLRKHQLPTVILPNGVDPATVPLAEDRREGPATFCVLSSNFPAWHGLDIILDSLTASGRDWRLHLAGAISPDMRAICERDKRIILHGTLDTNGLGRVLAASDVGVGGFGLDRIGLRQGSTLKVREYLARGLPVLIGHEDPSLPPGTPFVRRLRAFRSDDAIDFALEMRAVRRETVRETSLPWIDKTTLMRQFVRDLRENLPWLRSALP